MGRGLSGWAINTMIKATISLLGFLLTLAGCQSPTSVDYTPTVARFFLEEAAARTVSATLPQSGVRVMIGAMPNTPNRITHSGESSSTQAHSTVCSGLRG